MSKQRVAPARAQVPIDDIEDRIINCRSDAAWKELAISAKVRVLVIERLDQIEAEKRP